MAYNYPALKAILQAAADAIGREPKLALGSLGEMEYPPVAITKVTRDTGQLWTTGESPVDLILQYLGIEMDKRAVSWARVFTEGAVIGPTINGSWGVDNVVKNVVLGRLDFELVPGYADANYSIFPWVMNNLFMAQLDPATPMTDTTFSLFFYDTAGLLKGCDSLDVSVVCVGQM